MNSDDEFDDLDLDKLPGIYDDNFQNNELEYLKEDQIQIFPNLTEKPIYPSYTKNIINQQIENNINNLNKKEEEIFTFKNINNKKGKIKKINNEYNNNKSPIINYIHKRIEEDKINANIMSFEELLKKNKSKSKNKKLSDLKDKKENKNRIKIDFTRKLYRNKKIFENEKVHKDNIKQNKRNEIINNLPHNKSEISMRTKKIYKQNNMIRKTKNTKNNEKEKILYNYFKLKNPSKKKSNIILNYKNKEIILNFENQKEQNKNKSFITEDNSRDTSLIMNKSSRTIKSKNNKKKNMNIMNEIEDKIKIILKKDNSKNNITKRHPNIENGLDNFDKSKFEKYNTEQMRYDLVKDYSFIHAEKDDNFLNRMEFDFVKRKNKEKKLDELIEKNKNKYKLNESERKKTFNRLIDDANRRITMKQELIENEKYLTEYKDIYDNQKKYNQEEWDKIYKKRFKDYEDIKNKKMDIQRQNEKIKKILKEEEEINMCPKKKIPLREIKLSSERLYNDAKRRDYLRNNKYKNLKNDKSSTNLKYYKNNICLTNINEQEGNYSFLSERKNNLNNSKKRNINVNNKLLNDKRKQKKFGLRFEINNNNKYKYSKNENKNNGNNLNFSNNIIQTYFNFKKDKKKNNYDDILSPLPTMPCEYNYNNFNIYNINNLNNNINSKFNNNYNKDINNDNDYLFNITNQLIKSAALNKIDNNNNDYKQKLFNKEIRMNTDNNINNPESEGYQIIEQFLSSQFENYN